MNLSEVDPVKLNKTVLLLAEAGIMLDDEVHVTALEDSVVAHATARLAARLIANGTHRLATKEERDQWHAKDRDRAIFLAEFDARQKKADGGEVL